MASMSKNLEHGYDEGLNLEISTFSSGVESNSRQHLPAELLRFPQDAAELQAHVAETVGDPYRGGKAGGAQVEWALIPGGGDSGRITVVSPGWGCDFKTPLAQRDWMASLAADPERSLLVYNAPGVGASTPLNPDFARDLARSGRFENLGRYLLQRLSEPLKDSNRIDFVGDSQGGRHAIGMVSQMQTLLARSADELRLLDPIGSRDQGLLRLLYSFMIVEGGRSGKVSAASADVDSQRLQQELDSATGFVQKIRELIGPGGIGVLIAQIRALCHGTLGADLLLALPNVKGALEITTPECSALTDENAVQETLRGLSYGKSTPEIRHRVLPGRVHSLHAANPMVLGRLLSRAPLLP